MEEDLLPNLTQFWLHHAWLKKSPPHCSLPSASPALAFLRLIVFVCLGCQGRLLVTMIMGDHNDHGWSQWSCVITRDRFWSCCPGEESFLCWWWQGGLGISQSLTITLCVWVFMFDTFCVACFVSVWASNPVVHSYVCVPIQNPLFC